MRTSRARWSKEAMSDGEQVFVTGYQTGDKKGDTAGGLLRLLGQACYGQSLDPDSETPYEVAAGIEAEVSLMMSFSGVYRRFKIWQNVKEENVNPVFSDVKLSSPIAMTNADQLTLNCLVLDREVLNHV